MHASSPQINRRFDWVIGAFVGLAGSIYLFKDWLLAGARADKLWSNPLDPALMHWIVEWVYHILFERGDPSNFWNANQFYPNLGTLAYSDTLVGLQLVYAPLRWLGTAPLTALYASLMVTCVAGSAFTFVVLRRISDYTPLETALITFAAHFTLSITAFLSHYQLFAFQFAPSVLLLLYVYLKDFRTRDLLLCCALFSTGVCIAGYFAPMVGSVAIVAGGSVLIGQARALGIRQLASRIGWQSIALVAFTGALLYLLQLAPYVALSRALPRQSIVETTHYSSGLLALVRGFSPFSMWYQPISQEWGYWEYANFPGALLLMGGVVYAGSAVLAFIRKHFAHTPNSPVPLSLNAFLWVVFATSVLFSWGPVLKTLPTLHLPLWYLGKVIPGLDSIRAPGRFGILIGLPLAMMLVSIARHWLHGRIRTFAMVAMLAFIVVESLPRYQLYDFAVDRYGNHAVLSGYVHEGDPVLILPVSHADNIQQILLAVEQLNGSTLHWARLPVGYGSGNAPQYLRLLELDRAVQANAASPQALLDFAREHNIHTIMLETTRYSQNVIRVWARVLQQTNAEILAQDDTRVIVRLKA